MSKLCLSLILGIAVVFGSIPAQALNIQAIYMTNGGKLYTLDTLGHATEIGTFPALDAYFGPPSVVDIAFSGNTLYGAPGEGADYFYNTLIINPDTAEITDTNLRVAGFCEALTGDADGTLYSMGRDFSATLYKTNPVDGNTIAVRTTGMLDPGEYFMPGGLAIGPDGTLYGTAGRCVRNEYGDLVRRGWLYKIDKSTGVATPLGDIGYNVDGLAFLDGILYGVDGYGSFLKIDTDTGLATYIAETVPGGGLATVFIPLPASILLLGSGLFGLLVRSVTMPKRIGWRHHGQRQPPSA
jgi:hypothetical protein